MEIAATLPADLPPADVGAWATRVEAMGFDVLHVPETVHDPFVRAALAAVATEHLTIRTSMVVAFPRSPMVTAYAAWDLARLSSGRFQLGVASQVRGNIVGRYSTSWSDPVAQLEDYIGSLRSIFESFQTGQQLDHHGSHYEFTRLQPYFNPGPLEHSAPSIWTGGVNRRMCELAGRVSDGFVCHPTNSHPAVLSEAILPALEHGRAASGRTDAGPFVVAGPQPITGPSTSDVTAELERRRQELAFLYSTPAYRPQLAAFGLDELGERLSALAADDDWDHLDQHLPRDLIARLVPIAPYDELPDVLADWYTGQCHGLVLVVPSDPRHDERFSRVVERCRAITPRQESPAPSS